MKNIITYFTFKTKCFFSLCFHKSRFVQMPTKRRFYSNNIYIMLQKYNRPAISWAKPVQNIQLQKALLETENYDDKVKNVSLFDEIFPAKKSLSDVEHGELGWQEDNTFYKAIGPVMVTGQFFGILPVSGLMGTDYTSIKFSWKAWRVLYSFILMLFTLFMVSFCVGRILDDGVDIYRTISFMFFTSAFTSLILFMRMAPRWPGICGAIAKEELEKNPIYYQIHKKRNRYSLKVRFCMWTFGVLFFALVEHLLSIISGVAVAHDCPQGKSDIHNYFINAYPQVFYFTDFSIPKALFLQPVNFLATFNWNFMDLFIILISITLTERFELLGDRLETIIGQQLPEHFWKNARIEYSNLARLVKTIDDNVNKLVLLSFANNLYFICLQLFNSLNNTTNEQRATCGKLKKGQFRAITHILYFAYSFGFLLTRSLLVSLGAAKINSAAQRPAVVLYSVPSESYCTEVRRFLDQVTSDVIGLTGYSFFYVTRGLILTIAGTIVTYELVLVQFNTSPQPVTANVTINGVQNCTGQGNI